MNEPTTTTSDRVAQVHKHIEEAMKLLDETAAAAIPSEGLGSVMVRRLAESYRLLCEARGGLPSGPTLPIGLLVTERA